MYNNTSTGVPLVVWFSLHSLMFGLAKTTIKIFLPVSFHGFLSIYELKHGKLKNLQENLRFKASI